MVTELFWLLFSHFLADYGLQPAWVADLKKKDNYILLAHSVIWGGVIAVCLHYFGMLAVWKVVFLIGGHFLMDYIKCHNKRNIWVIDQAVHFLQLLIVLR